MKINLNVGEVEEINLTPLIDCVFLMLIFFMVATTFDIEPIPQEEIQEVLINLPEASSSIIEKGLTKPIVIKVDIRGGYYFNGDRVNVSELHKRLKTLGQESPEQRIRIDGDKDVAFQYIAHILDLCQFVGLHNIGAGLQ